MIEEIASLISYVINQGIQLLNTPILPGFSLSMIISVALFLTAITFITKLLI